MSILRPHVKLPHVRLVPSPEKRLGRRVDCLQSKRTSSSYMTPIITTDMIDHPHPPIMTTKIIIIYNYHHYDDYQASSSSSSSAAAAAAAALA